MLTLSKRLVRDLLETSDLCPFITSSNFVTLSKKFTSVLSTLGLALIFTYGLYQPNSTWGGVITTTSTTRCQHHIITFKVTQVDYIQY